MFFDKYELIIGEKTDSPFMNKYGVYQDGKPWGNHYNAIVPDDKINQPNIIASNEFSILNNHNGTDVARYKVELRHKDK